MELKIFLFVIMAYTKNREYSLLRVLILFYKFHSLLNKIILNVLKTIKIIKINIIYYF